MTTSKPTPNLDYTNSVKIEIKKITAEIAILTGQIDKIAAAILGLKLERRALEKELQNISKSEAIIDVPK